MHSTSFSAQNLTKYFVSASRLSRSVKQHIRAVDDVSFEIHSGETLGVVGESGCGKTTLARTALLLTPPSAGKIFLNEKELTNLSPAQLRAMRAHMQIVFQDPISSLDPRMRARNIVMEPLSIVPDKTKAEKDEAVAEIFEKVGLNPEHLNRFPHEFSGGQRQRIGIARAFVTKPSFIILDEPTSALDASVQSQILNLLKDLQREFQLGYLFISHNVDVVRYMSNRIAVMYLGRFVEIGDAREIFSHPLHPYTEALVASVPKLSPRNRSKPKVAGETPSPIDIPTGCRFHPRCPYAQDKCKTEDPQLTEVEKGRWVSCHFPL
ncbi:MAG TPA: oligopeptide/dipeptide ABC transporter ATP-binding protein [Candidatus Bathyarchaeia archaeon]|nr:oligopeptide/dipeptide ABC transporter ATP-binding protein [Candidatus Bathyarchaeia archaeon]